MKILGIVSLLLLTQSTIGTTSAWSAPTLLREAVHGKYFDGKLPTDDADAMQSYAQACADWKAGLQASAGSALLSADCGQMELVEHVQGGVQYGSEATLVLRDGSVALTLDEGLISSFVPTNVDASDKTAYFNYRKRCKEFHEFIRAVAGPRILYATCGEPTLFTKDGTFYTGMGTILFRSFPSTVAVEETVMGFSSAQHSTAEEMQSATKRYNENCQSFRKHALKAVKDGLAFASCGDPVTRAETADGGYQISGSARLYFRATLHKMTTETIVGPEASILVDAYKGFQIACRNWKASVAQRHGSSLAYASCGSPVSEKVKEDTFRFTSVGSIYLK